MNENWATRHEYEALQRYRLTHQFPARDCHPIDPEWLESEFRQVICLINNDPIRPSYSQCLLIEDKHRFWLGRLFG